MPRGMPAPQTVPSVIILGADAVFAALPATPVQLAHACQRLGYASAFPATWGDELIAGACLRELEARGSDPAILCTCPNVRERLLRSGDDLSPWMISLVPPPVAVARYLRAAYGARLLHITYAGSCPGARDAAIDAQISPSDLLALCREHGVSPAGQPQFFEGVIPPDRRRSLSMPGGAPSDGALRETGAGHYITELAADDALADLAERLIARSPVLIDLAPHVGCACSGIGEAVGGGDERRDLIALEPPRSRESMLDPAVLVDLAMPLPNGSPRPPTPPSTRAQRRDVEDAPLRPSAPLPSLEAAESSHAVIREYPHGEIARRPTSVLRRRGASETPAAQLAGVNVPRAYLGKRPRHVGARRARAAQIDGRRSRTEKELRIDRGADIADARRPRRTPRSNVIPIPTPSEPQAPVPPPPSKRKPGTALDLGAIIGLALSIISTGALSR
jgi:hypothetical protein